MLEFFFLIEEMEHIAQTCPICIHIPISREEGKKITLAREIASPWKI